MNTVTWGKRGNQLLGAFSRIYDATITLQLYDKRTHSMEVWAIRILSLQHDYKEITIVQAIWKNKL